MMEGAKYNVYQDDITMEWERNGWIILICTEPAIQNISNYQNFSLGLIWIRLSTGINSTVHCLRVYHVIFWILVVPVGEYFCSYYLFTIYPIGYIIYI